MAYKPTWESLTEAPLPQWLLDAKFGIYAHWGPYSVPAYKSEWYPRMMYDQGSDVYEFHCQKYGDPAEFGYKDLIPYFKAEKYDPEEWAELIESAGAQYAGLAVVHHDGFCLWDSNVTRWNAARMGPERDLYGELVQALRKRNLNTLATFHHLRTFDWYLPGVDGLGNVTDREKLQSVKDSGLDLIDPAYADLYWNELTGKYEDFLEEWKQKVMEVVDLYAPDALWFDGGEFRGTDAEPYVQQALAYYMNNVTDATIMNKLPVNMKFNFPYEMGILTYEEGRDRDPVVDRPWIDDMKIGNPGWCYVEGQQYRSPRELLCGLIDRVSRGGGLILNLSPYADGSFPEEQKRILKEIGDWLKVNGESIYGADTWRVHAEGDDQRLIVGDKHPKWQFGDCNAGDIRFTTKPHTLYVHVLGWPEDKKVKVESLKSGDSPQDIRRINLLNTGQSVPWHRDEAGLTLDLAEVEPRDTVLTFKIQT